MEVVPGPIQALLAALAAAVLFLFVRGRLAASRAGLLARQREELEQDVGLLQKALLPDVPARFGDLRASVAYRPAEGLASGGGFYDAFPLPDGRVGLIVGDVAGHGKDALARSASMRITLRAYMEAGLEPRTVLRLGGQVMDESSSEVFVTVVAAVHDPERGTLTYACAGHPPPILAGTADYVPVTAVSAAPLGVGVPTGQRQTTVDLPAGSVACLFTDGLIEARIDGDLYGTERLTVLVGNLPPEASAEDLLGRLRAEADEVGDDMAVCLLRSDASGQSGESRKPLEELEISPDDLDRGVLEMFLEACDIPTGHRAEMLDSARAISEDFGSVVLRVTRGLWPDVEVLPGNVETLQGASLARAAIASRSA